MPPRLDITGQVFNGITALKFSHTDKLKRSIWSFKCHCGKLFNNSISEIKSGGTKSCGCKHYEHDRGSNNFFWKGGRYLDKDGYVIIYNPNYKYNKVREHIFIAEKILGKSLSLEHPIHHYGKKDDNKKIVICEDHGYHMLLHRRTRAYKACGNSSWLKCKFCKQYDNPVNLYVSKNNKVFYHRECHNKYEQNRTFELKERRSKCKNYSTPYTVN